jgi:hypothetical protein
MTINAAAYRRHVAYSEKTWNVTDQTLYRLCRENPDHNRRSSVCAKLWIIGRTFVTGIERKVATKRTQGSSMSQVADLFVRRAAKSTLGSPSRGAFLNRWTRRSAH